MTETRKFTREEVSNHNSKTGSMFIIDNIVYDVSSFLDEHPGGHEVLLGENGKDTSEMFEDIGHSVDAKKLMKDFAVGELVPEDWVERTKREIRIPYEETTNYDNSFTESWKFPVLLGIVVTLLYTYFFS